LIIFLEFVEVEGDGLNFSSGRAAYLHGLDTRSYHLGISWFSLSGFVRLAYGSQRSARIQVQFQVQSVAGDVGQGFSSGPAP
jgi:hypothetical protein